MSYIQNINSLFEPKLKSPTASRSKSYKNSQVLPPKHGAAPRNNEYKQVAPSPKYQYRNDLSQQYQIGQDIVKVLREENLNLKEQNNFLIQKLRLLTEKEEESTELSLRHEEILEDLKIENVELKKELRYMNQLASSKVEEFGKKLAKITRMSEEEIANQSNVSIRDLNPPTGVLGLRSAQSDDQKYPSNKKYPIIVQKPSLEQRTTEEVGGRSLEDLKNEFDAILYSCKVEKDNQQRKKYRKRLIQLTNQMKQLSKK